VRVTVPAARCRAALVKKRAINSKYRAVGRDLDHRTHKTTIQIAVTALPNHSDP
jgi:hypothetical protein